MIAFRIADTEAVAGCGSLACEIAEVVTSPAVITSVVLSGLAALVALTYVRDAASKCRQERQRIVDERDAFIDFADRVAALDSGPPPSSVVDSTNPSAKFHQTRTSERSADINLQQVLSIYRDTVMSVSHYETDYNETVSKSLAAELGPDTVTSLAANKTLSPAVQDTLVSRSHKAANARDSLADVIEIELDTLTDIESELSTIDQRRRHLVTHAGEVDANGTGAALDIWHQLNDLEAEIETIATERQQTLRNPPMQIDTGVVDTDEMAFYNYLYGPTNGPSHPVLAQIADLTAEIHDDRDCVATQIGIGD